MDNNNENDGSFLKTDLQRKIAGYISAFITSLSASIVIMSGQIINDNEPPFQTSAIRFATQTIFALILLIAFRKDPRIPLQWRPLTVMFISTFVTFGAGIFFILSSWYLPVTVVHGTMESTVMVLAGILACARRRCHIELPIGIIVCSIGCLLLSQPEFIFHNLAKQNSTYSLEDEGTVHMRNCTQVNLCENVKVLDLVLNCTAIFCSTIIHHNPSMAFYGFLFVLGLGFCLWQNSQFNVEYLFEYTSVTSMLFWLGLGCSILSLPIMFLAEAPEPIQQPFNIVMVIIFSVAFTLNLYSMMYTVTLIPLSHAAMILPTAMVYLYIFQKTFLKDIQPGPDNWLEKVGLVLVIAGALLPPAFDISREKFTKSGKIEKKPLMGRDKLFQYDSFIE